LEPLVEVVVALPRSGQTYRLLRPLHVDPLLQQAERDPEGQLPYWAELWPSGIALADAVSVNPELVRSVPVLELGCGLGVTAAAALRAGAVLLAADYAPEALLLTRLNCLANAGREPKTLQLNWRRPPAELLASCRGAGFPVVLAADVLYEERDVEPLFHLAGLVVAPGGLLWLAEPGRRAAARFLELVRAAGWDGPATTWDGPWPDPLDERVTVTVHRLRRP
jgi:predicted nicotinamide N-methyase